MVVLMGIFGQFSGNGLGYFNLSIYEAVGFDSNMQFILNLANNILCGLGAFTGVALSDRIPRRKVLLALFSAPSGLVSTGVCPRSGLTTIRKALLT